MKITVLAENSGPADLISEHGLSLLIDFNETIYLLDTGSSDAFLKNMKTMSISPAMIDTCVLSHGHYDHSSGFEEFFKVNENAPVYSMDDAFEYYIGGTGNDEHYIGVPEGLLENHRERFHLLDGTTEIAENVFVVPHFTEGLEKLGKRAGLYRRDGEKTYPDDFSHELSLVFNTDKGLVVFNSCSHGGIVNILREVKEELPGFELYAFLGGLHMRDSDKAKSYCMFTEQEIQNMAREIRRAGLQKLYAGHCTGEMGFRIMKKYLGEMVMPLTTGQEIKL